MSSTKSMLFHVRSVPVRNKFSVHFFSEVGWVGGWGSGLAWVGLIWFGLVWVGLGGLGWDGVGG